MKKDSEEQTSKQKGWPSLLACTNMPALKRKRHEDQKFKARLGNTVSLRPATLYQTLHKQRGREDAQQMETFAINPEFNSLVSHGRKKQTPENCPLTATQAPLVCMYTHSYIPTLHKEM